MLFNSYIFIFLFLPLSLAGYFFWNKSGKYEWGKLWLTAMSLWFYAWFNVSYLPIIVVSVLGNYGLYRILLGSRGRDEVCKRNLYLTVAGVAANLGILFYYKYFDFFLENINAMFHMDLTLQHVLLPLGISFFTFQQVGFLVDTYREETKNYSFIDYALFVTFFPQLVAGPIVTHDEIICQFQDSSKKRWNTENASRGMYAFVCGLGKKVLLADIFGKAVSWGFANLDSMNGLATLWMMVCYMVQLYLDFSGYCDMARGIGYLFNIHIPVNFFSPYKSVNLVDFWKRWHITLNRFFTKYVYIPLGGNRKGKVRTWIHIFMIYLVSGIWHGAGWTYLCWGVLHGIVYVLTRQMFSAVERIPKVLAWFFNMAFFLLSLVFFRAENLGQAVLLLQKMVTDSYGLSEIPEAFIQQFQTPEFFYCMKVLRLDGFSCSKYILMFGYMAIAWFMLLCCKNVTEKTEDFRPTYGKTVFVTILFLWSVVSFSEVSAFLYFNF